MENLEQESVDDGRDHGPWPVTLGKNQEPIGLPDWIKPENVILRLTNKGGWEAVNPLPDDVKDFEKWRGGTGV